MTTRQALMTAGLAACLVGPAAAIQKAVDPEVLFQSALYKEQVELKLDLAIAGYKEAVAAAGSNRAIAAKALLHMAGCYERLGKPEAKATYELIVTRYAASEPAATTARTRLAQLNQEGSGLVVRHVWQQSGVGYYANGSTISPDGRTLAFVDWNTGDMGVHDLASGQTRLLTSDALRTETYAEDPVFSPDGSLIAYGLETDTDQPYEIRVIDPRGGAPRTVRRAANPSDKLYVAGWHPDGKRILATEGPDGGVGRKDLVLVALGGGATQVLISKFTNVGSLFKISPDGRFVTYSARADGVGDLVALPIGGGPVQTIHKHPANDRLLDWTPDGNRVFFLSDRGGGWGIWSIGVRNGIAVGEPVLVRPETGNVESTGFTKNGDFYFEKHTSEHEVYVATLATAARGQAPPLTRLESRFQGLKTQAVWSPTGDRLAYMQGAVAAPPGPAASQTIAIHTVNTGAVRKLTVALSMAVEPVWLPDGRSLIVRGTDLEKRQGLHRVDVESGAVSTVALPDAAARTSSRRRPAVSPDGRQVFFSNPGGVGISARIIQRDLVSGDEKIVINEAAANYALSPNGEWLALTRQGAGPDLDVVVAPAAGGETRRLASFPAGWTESYAVAWSVDGRLLFVAKRAGSGVEIWAVPFDGSAPWHTGVTWSGHIHRISAHPDGRRLAISTERLTSEVSALSNLPAAREK